MTPLAALLILASAGLHASWNLIAKKERVSLAFYAMWGFVGVLWSTFVRFVSPIYFFSMPPEFYLNLAGMLAGELMYGFGLILAYRALDMSTAYPMMRALPLLLTALLTTLFGWGKPLSAAAMAGMAVVFAGCLMMPLGKFSEFKLRNYCDRSMLYILLVACGTTTYTIFDSNGQSVMREAFPEVSRTMISLTYYAFRALTLNVLLWLIVLSVGKFRSEAAELFRRISPMPFLAGLCSSLTYVLVLIAMNFVSNVSYVQAFRQIGLLIGMLEGIFILKERCTPPKAAGIVLILAGLALTLL